MKMNSLKRLAVLLFVVISLGQVLRAQGPWGGWFGPPRDRFMPPLPPPALAMKSCGDYLFVLEGATLYRFNAVNAQQAGSISLVDSQVPPGPPMPLGLLIPAGGSGKPESLLVLLGNRLFVVNPSTFTKPKPISLPEPQAPEKPEPKVHAPVGAASGQEAPAPPTPQANMGGPPEGPGFGEQAPPPPPMGRREPGGHAFGPGDRQMSPRPPLPPMPQVELKGSKLFLTQGRRLVAIDYLSGDVKTVALPDLRQPEK
jgi:hypothetical protein